MRVLRVAPMLSDADGADGASSSGEIVAVHTRGIAIAVAKFAYEEQRNGLLESGRG